MTRIAAKSLGTSDQVLYCPIAERLYAIFNSYASQINCASSSREAKGKEEVVLGEKFLELEIDFRTRAAVASEACFDNAHLVVFRTLAPESRLSLV